jgi:hypothetical protein
MRGDQMGDGATGDHVVAPLQVVGVNSNRGR